MSEPSFEEESYEASDLASADTNISHEGGYRSSFTDADESVDRSLHSFEEGYDDQIPLAGDEDEEAEERPPMINRLAAGVRKSLTNLFSIFGSAPAQENPEEEEDEGSYEQSYEASSVDTNGSHITEGDGSVEVDADHMEMEEDRHVKEAENENEGAVSEKDDEDLQESAEGAESSEGAREGAEGDVEIHSLLLDEGAGVGPLATGKAQEPNAKAMAMEAMVVEEEELVVEVFEIGRKKEQAKQVEEEEEKEKEEEEEEKEEEGEEEEEEEEVSQEYIDEMDKRFRALTKTALAAQLKRKGEKAYGLKEELVVRLRNACLREEKEQRRKRPATAAAAAVEEAASATPPKRKRGRPRKYEAKPKEEEEQQIVEQATEKRRAKRQRGEEEEEEKEEKEKTTEAAAEEEEGSQKAAETSVESTTETRLMWPSLVPKTQPRAYEPSCGWSALLPGANGQLAFSLPDPDTVHEWDLENDEGLRNQVALLRLWVLSQPIDLERKHSKTNPTFFEALESWKFAKEKKVDTSKQQQSYAEWVYGVSEPPQLPLQEETTKRGRRK